METITKPKQPEIGIRYSRDEIHEMFGGSKQSALPFVNGDAVAGCYVPEMNPKAPEEILVGVGRYKEYYSRRAAEQKTILPIFLKRGTSQYEFVGYYQATEYCTDRNKVAESNKTDRNNEDIAAVLYFEEAKSV